jgi:hypothetical protein
MLAAMTAGSGKAHVLWRCLRWARLLYADTKTWTVLLGLAGCGQGKVPCRKSSRFVSQCHHSQLEYCKSHVGQHQVDSSDIVPAATQLAYWIQDSCADPVHRR